MEFRTGILIACVLPILGSIGCSDDDDNRTDPATQCAQLVNSMCDKFASCATSGGIITDDGREQFISECKTGVQRSLPCERAVAVRATYSQCIQEMNGADCGPIIDALNGVISASNVLPASCQGVVNVRSTDVGGGAMNANTGLSASNGPAAVATYAFYVGTRLTVTSDKRRPD